jgi:hypothetical protein
MIEINLDDYKSGIYLCDTCNKKEYYVVVNGKIKVKCGSDSKKLFQFLRRKTCKYK